MSAITDPIFNFVFSTNYKDHYLVQNGYFCFSIIALYVLFSISLGPRLMANRKAFQLKNTLIVYNLLLSSVNLYLAIAMGGIMVEYWSVRCRFRESDAYPLFFKKSGMVIWHVYLVKFVELFDTVFFVLRKKYNQISFLHVFHHTFVCAIFFWILSAHRVGFYLFLVVTVNCSIHVMMYCYYGLAAIGPHMQKYLWWKKHLTAIQIIQFCLFQLYLGIGFLQGCEFFEPIEISLFLLLSSLLVLFLNFYIKTFKKKD